MKKSTNTKSFDSPLKLQGGSLSFCDCLNQENGKWIPGTSSVEVYISCFNVIEENNNCKKFFHEEQEINYWGLVNRFYWNEEN